MSDYGVVRGCKVPKDLYYSVDDHTWVRVNDDGTVTVGMTDVAQNLAGPVLHAKVKKVGLTRAKGKPIGTVESAKWVGPIKTPVSGEIVAVNENLAEDPQLLNRDPYGDGWVVKMKPTNWDEEVKDLVTGEEAVQKYLEKVEREDIKACEHIE